MHSPAAVALTQRLAAIFRLDMPAADSLSTSRMLRMGNLGPGMPRSRGKEAKPCRFADPDRSGFACWMAPGCQTPINWLVSEPELPHNPL
jgi:hypothetical protein